MKKGFTLVELLISITVIIIPILMLIPFLFNLNIVINDEGLHTGYITAIQKNGVFFKKYSVYFKTDRSSSQEDIYCVPDNKKELIGKLKQAQKRNERINIQYYDKFVMGVFNGYCENDEIYGFSVNK